MKYNVIRQHLGDKMYMPGDSREASPGEVKHLLANGVIEEAKADPKPANKAEPKLQNKSDARGAKKD